MSDCEFFELPSFEAFDSEDRPPPPSIEDYPIGCEVELVDIGPAKTAQTAELWEPFMDELFGQCRRSVRVVRHQGDYTFVMCEIGQDLVVGCTLYRACLSEPKVRFRKYIPSNPVEGRMSPIGVNTRDPSDSDLFELYPNTKDVGHEAEGIVPTGTSLREKDPQRANTWGSQCISPDESPRLVRSRDKDAESEIPLTKKGDVVRCKYNYAIRKAHDAMLKENYRDAVRYYTKAIKYSPDGGARCLSNRSVAFLGLRNVEAAFLDATRAIELQPQNFVGYVRAGNTLRGMKRYEEARTYYEKALALDPSNETLNYLLLSNNVMMLYASKYEHRKAASIALDRKTLNVVLLAKKDMRPGELAWVESSAAVFLLRHHGNLACSGDHRVHGDQNKESIPHVCCQCFRPLTSIEEFCKSLPEVEPHTLKKFYSEHKIVQCNGQCGVLYCSDSCRSKAWAAHHWVECVTQGKWSEAYSQVPGLLKNFIASYSAAASKERQSSANINPEIGICLTPTVEDSPDVIVACVRIACRMFSKILSNGRVLEDAVHIFEWMLPKESSYSSFVSPPFTNMAHKTVIVNLLTSVYNALQKCFTTEEAHYFSFNAFRSLVRACQI
ncbi:hypothetical protein TraAM80_00805 [Trypanosoma rangeli]|uniref:Uncharacterized protein n=1 Tax=Trypanosoma rangeli TaxID=5698 RepID=A0A3R7KXE4_TRYRA|nr:uncharacterized protein TraAM80_00805 [Trypanosoma rangeli]RNF11613.1 hypothetical protein TraAM80_00805 [Trypanosoma rangeli]|eukprot:RNF11613.1 hypothetical protein TraAM80_00805 [Trypanosoma rangeli]